MGSDGDSHKDYPMRGYSTIRMHVILLYWRKKKPYTLLQLDMHYTSK